MFVFPAIYLGSFIAALISIWRNKPQGILVFLICALPIYTTTLSITFQYGFGDFIPFIQSFKELMILIGLWYVIMNKRGPLKLHLIDQLILFFFIYNFLYIILPVGQFGILKKLLAFKSQCFFVPVYFVGRFFEIEQLHVKKYFRFICAVTFFASLLLIYELFTYTHFQTFTGYADYNFYFFNQEPSGNYGLSWTFEVNEIGKGAKRFASFFSNPLEFAAATVMTTSILAALYTDQRNKIKIDSFGFIVLLSTFFCIFFALSRASMASYFLMIYTYSFLTGKRKFLRFIHIFFLIVVIAIVFFADKDVKGFIINTITFANLSSLGHVIEWLDGIQSMISHPFGIGLGESGRIAGSTGDNVGGESQLIIVGVQSGVLILLVYIAIYFLLVRTAYKYFHVFTGKERKISLAIFLMKIGFIVPMLTSNFESYIYLSYLTWFLSGILVNTVVTYHQNKKSQVELANA